MEVVSAGTRTVKGAGPKIRMVCPQKLSMHIAGRILFDSLVRYSNAPKTSANSDNDFIGLGNAAAAPHTSAPKVILSSSDESVIIVDLDGKSYDKSQRWMKPKQNLGYYRGFERYCKTLPQEDVCLGKSNLTTIAKKMLMDRYLESNDPMTFLRIDTPLGKMLIGYPGNESG